MHEFDAESTGTAEADSRTWYVLPTPLWTALKTERATSHIAANDLEHEQKAAEAAEDRGCVGFRNRAGIIDALLRSPGDFVSGLSSAKTDALFRSDFMSDYLAAWGKTPEQLTQEVSLANERLEYERTAPRGFCGWLWTNPQFRREYLSLHDEAPDIFDPARGTIQFTATNGRLSSTPGFVEGEVGGAQAAWEFCERWRLTGITGFATVEPLGRQDFSALPELHAIRAQTSGALTYTPDILPLPDRDELRRRTEEVVRASISRAPHLREWTELVMADTQGKKSIDRFGRWYRLQHFWRVLHSRYAMQLRGKRGRVTTAFATYFGVSETTLKDDLRAIHRRLGKGWELDHSKFTQGRTL